MQVVLEFPDRYVADGDAEALAERVKRYAALVMFASGELSAGAAAEVSGLDRFELAEECSRRGLALVHYPSAELANELDSLSRLGG